MALQELSPLPPVTGFASLGNVIANAGADYLGRTRQLEDAARVRGQQLQDVASARAFTTAEGDKRRREGLEDAETLGRLRDRLAGIQILVNEGFLDGSRREDDAAVKEAFARFQQAGIDKQYAELWQTPDPATGAPLLTREQSTDAAAVQAAKDKLGAIKARQIQFQQGQQGNAQATIDGMNRQLAEIRAQKDAIVNEANRPVPQIQPNDPRAVQLAAQLAEQMKPGSGRNREAVAAQLPTALKQLNDQALLAWSQAVQSAKLELESLRRSEAEITSSLERAMGTFKIAPSNSAAVGAVLQQPVAATSAPRAASAEDIAAAMRAVVGGRPASPEASQGASGMPAQRLLENPTGNAVIAAGNADLAQRNSAQAQAILNAAIEEGRLIDQKLNEAANVQRPTLGMGITGMTAQNVADPVASATQTSALLKAKAANDAKVEALRAQLLGPTPAGVTAPAVNTASTSTPTPAFAVPQASQWWNARQSPAPASGM